MTDRSDPESDLPESLKKGLRETFGEGPRILGEMDQLVLENGRRHLALRRKFRKVLSWSAAGAVAASLAVGWMLWPKGNENLQTASMENRPTILRAFQIDRAIRAGKTTSDMDKNRDGKVDQADVDWVGNLVVKVEGGS